MAATDLLIWGIVVHLVIDWLGQNEWVAVNKAKRAGLYRNTRWYRWSFLRNGAQANQDSAITTERDFWWLRHPAAYVHAGMHGAAQLLVFPWWAALAIGVTHLLIDTRIPVVWWSKLIRQTQPIDRSLPVGESGQNPVWVGPLITDLGQDVRMWADQVWHIAVIALLALVAA